MEDHSRRMQVVILCGGMGTRLREETESRPKPMVQVGEQPILWHIMKTFSYYGYQDFILCLGYKGDLIKHYFLNYERLNSDLRVELGSGNIEIFDSHDEQGWRVTLVDTGLHTMTGGRVKMIEKYIENDTFMLTYGDGVTDLDITKLVDFYHKQGKIGLVTGVSPPSRYGELGISEERVISFREKPNVADTFISGGYFVLNKKFFSYLSEDANCILERDPLEKLTEDRQLAVYTHDGFWQCMDTYRDYTYLNELWNQNQAKWRVWNAP